MNANAEKWVAALESGEYQQTAGVLRDKDGFCCLGVACHLAAADGVVKGYLEDDTGCWVYGCDEDGESGVLPWAVSTWLGFAGKKGTYRARGTYRASDDDDRTLAYDNDAGASFAEIAQTIRTHPELFVDGES